MNRSISILVAALAVAGCSRGEGAISYPGPVPQISQKSSGLIYAPTAYVPPIGTPLYYNAKLVKRFPQMATPRPARPGPNSQALKKLAQAPRIAAGKKAPTDQVQAAKATPAPGNLSRPASKRVVEKTAVKPGASAKTRNASQPPNFYTPRLAAGPAVEKPKVYSPFPRYKPAKPRTVTSTAAGARYIPSRHQSRARTQTARPRTSTFTVPYTLNRNSARQSTPPIIEYHIPHLPQEEPLWCWAAAAQQAIGWINRGRAPAQCAVVALAHGIPIDQCCADKEGVCAKTGEIPEIAALVRRFGGQAAEATTVPRDPHEVYDILKSGSTLLIRLRPEPHEQAAGIRHMIVVRGLEWLRLPNGQLSATLHYNDPLGEGQRSVDFNEIVGFFEQALIVRRST